MKLAGIIFLAVYLLYFPVFAQDGINLYGSNEVEVEPSELGQVLEERIEDEEEILAGQTAEGLTMQVRLGFGRYIRRGQYFPVTVTIENTGRSRTGEIRIISQDPLEPLTAVFKAECNIPTNSRKTYYLYPYVFNPDPSPSIYIQYVEKIPVLTETLDLVMLNDEENLWMEVADEGASFTFMTNSILPNGSSFSDISQLVAEEPVSYSYGSYGSQPSSGDEAKIDYQEINPVTGWLRSGNLPDRAEGYKSIDGLILNTRRLYELTEDQMVALMEWIAGGGNMIAWLGDDPTRYQGSFLTGAVDGGDWVGPSVITEPVVRTTLTSLTAIPGLTGNRTVLGNFPVTYAPQDSARTLLKEGDIPVLQHLSFGRGDILLSGLDLAALKNVNPDGLDRYMSFLMGYLMSQDDRPSYIIRNHPDYYTFGMRGGFSGPDDDQQKFVTRSFYNVLQNLDNTIQTDNLTALPSLKAITLFLIGYIFIVGPINYFILLKMRRREWLWYTIPLIVTVFILGSYSWALQTKGSKLLLTRVNVIDAYPEHGLALQSSYFGLFSPAARRYDVKLAGEQDLIRELEIPNPSPTMYGMSADDQGSDDPLTLIQDGEGNTAYADNAYIRIWSEVHFETEGAINNPGFVAADDVSLVNNHLRGTLDVSLDIELEHPFLFYYTRGGFSTQPLSQDGDPVLSNGNFAFDLFLDIPSADPDNGVAHDLGLSPKENELRNVAIDILRARRHQNTPMDEIILAGFISGVAARPLESPRVRSVREQTLVLYHIPLDDVSGPFNVDDATGHILGLRATNMEIERNVDFLLEDGEMIYSVTFPPINNLTDMPGLLKLTVEVGRSGGRFIFTAFDHQQNQWVSLPEWNTSGYNITLSLNNISRFIADDGRTLLLKIEGNPEKEGDIISLKGISVYAS